MLSSAGYTRPCVRRYRVFPIVRRHFGRDLSGGCKAECGQQVETVSVNNFYFAGHDMGTLRGVDYSERTEMYEDAIKEMYQERLTPPCKGFIWDSQHIRFSRCPDLFLERLDVGNIAAAKEILRSGDMEYYQDKAKAILEAQ